MNNPVRAQSTGKVTGLRSRFWVWAGRAARRKLKMVFTLAYFEAVLRGWYPGWLAQLRGWSTQAVVLWTALAFVFVRTVFQLHSK